MELTLDPQEAKVLLQVLKNYLPGLMSTISNTENFDWRQEMKQDEEVLRRLCDRLEKLATGEEGSQSSISSLLVVRLHVGEAER
jgi:hypothetical protein